MCCYVALSCILINAYKNDNPLFKQEATKKAAWPVITYDCVYCCI